MWQVIDAGKQRSERLAVVHHAADARCHRNRRRNQAFSRPISRWRCRFAASPVIGECDLERRVDGFRAGVGEEDMVEPGGSNTREPIGGARTRPGGQAETKARSRGNELSVDGFSDLAPIVAGVYAPQTRCPVENAATVSAPVITSHRRARAGGFCLELGGSA